jgi:hypothetical protein
MSPNLLSKNILKKLSSTFQKEPRFTKIPTLTIYKKLFQVEHQTLSKDWVNYFIEFFLTLFIYFNFLDVNLEL